VAPASEKGKGPVSVLFQENRTRAASARVRYPSIHGVVCRALQQKSTAFRPAAELPKTAPRIQERKAREIPVRWVEVDDSSGYDVDLDTLDQYAAEDALYLYEGPLPDDDESAE
jgi:hypothetical protein